MHYKEVSLLGVYVAPFAVMMVAAWGITLPLRRLGDRLGMARFVWHPPLFNLAIYVIVLCLQILLFAG
jgi:hypothetical protein